MKKFIQKKMAPAALILMAIALLGCKGLDSDSGNSTVSIDISSLKNNLATSSSSSSASASSEVSAQVSSPETSTAQTTVKTLIVAPLTYSKHGKPYTLSEFDKTTEDDFEDDAANSANYLKFIQLPTSADTVEVEVPLISEGWQLLAVATKGTVASVDDLEDSVLVYMGFTPQAFTSVDDFNSGNVTLNMQRHCDQDEADRPKGCATYDGEKNPIVTAAVEIHAVYINGLLQGNGGNPFPWIVREVPVGGEINAAQAKTNMEIVIQAFNGGVNAITNITVYVTHQMSVAAQNRAGCDGETDSALMIQKCTEDGVAQQNTRTY